MDIDLYCSKDLSGDLEGCANHLIIMIVAMVLSFLSFYF